VNWNMVQRLSLKTRLTLFTLAVFLIGLWSLAIYASRTLREDMERQLGEQQFSIVSLLASEISEEFEDRFSALASVSGGITPAMLGDRVILQVFIEESLILQQQFNGGVIVVRPDGTAIADVPRSAGRIGVNYLDRDHVASALNEGKSAISQPVKGKKLSQPVFGMAVPIRDAQNRVIGALAGVTDLSKPNFLDKVTKNRYGGTGGYLLIAPKYRLIVTATDKGRIMQPLPAPGVNAQIDRFVQGTEGSAVYVNAVGVEILNSVKAIPAVGWYLAANLPTEEAFAPIRDMQRHMLLAAIVLTLFAGGLTWWITSWMLRRQLSPMIAATKALDALSRTNQVPQPLPITSQDEIGELITGFNRLIENLAERQNALQESEGRFRALVEWLPDAISVHRDGKRIYVNPAAVRLYGAKSAQDLVGRPVLDLIHPDSRQTIEARLKNMTGHGDSTQMAELRLLRLDGTAVDVELQSTEIIYERKPAVLTSVRDITERKQVEEALIERDSRYRTVVETSSDGFWVVDRDGRLLDANEAYARRSGYTREELLRMSIVDFEAKEAAADIAAHIDTIVRKGTDVFETLHQAKDGTVWPVEITVRHRSDRPGQILCFLRDITERIRVEEERKRSAEMLQLRTAELERSHQLLQALTAVQESIQEEERKRIARELHDELAQKLTVLKLQTRSIISTLSEGSPGLAQQAQEMNSLLTETMHAVSHIAANLRPPVLDELGLVSALHDLVEEFSERTRIECDFSVHPQGLSVDNRLATPLYRMVQEALTNVARHAEATEVIVSLYRNPSGKITLNISDDGKGLPTEKQPTRGSFGLIGMRERTAMLGGEITIHSQPGAGTSIEIVIP
jgi:PAS domain S-box-containing protein